MKIAILGAGITGLTIGYRLRERAPGLEFAILERDARAGGLMKSEVKDGFTLDTAGGHIMYTRKPELKKHLWGLLGGKVVESRRQTRIFYQGHYVNYPFENGLGDLPRDVNYRCLKGYLDAYMARQSGRAPGPTNLREWILWRFGEGIAEAFMYPYNEKIWNSDLTDMGYEWVSGRVPDAPPDDVIKSALGIPTEGYTHQIHFGYPERGGFQALVDATAAPIRDAIRLETPVTHVRRAGDRWEVNGESFDRVVSTIPLRSLPGILEGLDPSVSGALGRLQHVNVLCFLIGLSGPGRFPYSWVYLPHPENGPVNRLTHLSNYSPHNCPPGCSSVMCEVTFRGETSPDPEATLSEIIDRLDEMEIINRDQVVTTAFSREDDAYVYYSRDFLELIQQVRDHLDAIGFDTCGRTGRMEYFNADHCVDAAFALADRLLGNTEKRD